MDNAFVENSNIDNSMIGRHAFVSGTEADLSISDYSEIRK